MNMPQIDKNQALLHLSLLGFQGLQKIFIRAFLPSAGASDGGRKADSLKIEQAVAWNKEGRGIYLVVNGGGHKDADVTSGRAIFYEHDNIPKSEQIKLWQTLGLPEPTFQVDTGGKSIHSYWVFSEPIEIEKWRLLQRDLLDFADADRSIKNPSRVMRLSGFVHPQTKELSQIISNSGRRYTFESLREIVPTQSQEASLFKQTAQPEQMQNNNRQENINLPVAATVPLESCLAKSSRDLLNGVSEGGRNDAAAKLALDLIGTANYLNSIGQRFDGDPQNLLSEFGRRCNPPLPQKEVESVWKSVSRANPTPACKSDGVDSCVRGWYWNNYLKRDRNQPNNQNNDRSNSTTPKNNLSQHPTAQRLSEEELETELKKLIEDDPKKSAVSSRLSSLANRTERRDLSAIKEQYQALKLEQQNNDEKPQQIESLKEIAKLKTSTINPLDYLVGDNGKLARQLIETAEAMPTSASWLFTTLIAAAGSCIKADSKIMINPRSGYKQSAIFRTLIVANTGAKKTPAQNKILDPLMELEAEANTQYEQEKLQFDEELRQYESKGKKDRNNEPPPQAPVRKRFVLGDTTAEKLIKIHNENPNGFLVYRDEGSGFFTALNKYRGGNGDDTELDLSEFNGKQITVDRVSGSSFIKNPHICKVGSTQPKTFRLLMGKFDDSTGFWSRWLIDFSTGPLSKIDLDNDDETGLSESLTRLYRALANQESNVFGLSMPAKPIWQKYQHQLIDESVACNLEGLQAVYPKLETYFGRLCLWLHLVNAALANREPETQVSADTVQKAIALTEYYKNQWLIFHNLENPEVSSLTQNQLAIHNFAQRKGKPVTVRDIKSGIHCLKKISTPELIEFCELLSKTAGYGYWDGKAYSHIPKSVDVVDVLLMKHQHTQSHTQSIVDGVVDVVDDFFTNSKNSKNIPIVENGIFSDKGMYTENHQQHQQTHQHHTPQSLECVDVSSTKHQQHQQTTNISGIAETLVGKGVDAVDASVDDVDTLNETEIEITELIDDVIAEKDTDYAKDIQKVITSACDTGCANRKKIWNSLGLQKQAAFTELLNPKPSPVKIAKGVKVVYVGERPNCKAQYGGQVLIVEVINPIEGVTCKLPSGQLTTWLQVEELMVDG